MNKVKRIISVLLAVVMLLSLGIQSEIAFAATDPVRIWDIGSDEHRLNSSVVVNETCGELGYKLSGITEKAILGVLMTTKYAELTEAAVKLL